MTVPPYAVAYVVTVAVSWSADHFNRYDDGKAFLLLIQQQYAFRAVWLTGLVVVFILPFSPSSVPWDS